MKHRFDFKFETERKGTVEVVSINDLSVKLAKYNFEKEDYSLSLHFVEGENLFFQQVFTAIDDYFSIKENNFVWK
jgi:hypothetical protein